MVTVPEVAATTTEVRAVTPYHPTFVTGAKDIGGNWQPPAWVFDPRDEQRVRDLCVRIYGTDGAPTPTVSLRVRLGGWSGHQTAWIAGRRVAHRAVRDSRIQLGEGVVLIEGKLTSSGGSIANPRLGSDLDGTYVEVRDVPEQMAVDLAAKDSDVTVIEGSRVDPTLPEPATGAGPLVAAVLTSAQQETVEHFRAPNVPASWFVGEPAADGRAEVVALGDGFVWSFIIDPDGEFSSQECKLDPEGFSTGIEV